MSFGDRHFEPKKLPVTLGVLAVVAIVSVFAAITFLGDRRELVTPEAYQARTRVDALLEPGNEIVSKPVQAVGAGTNWIDDYLFAVRENEKLRAQVSELSQYRDKYIQLKDVNSRFEKILNLRTEPLVDTVAARSVMVSRGPFNNSRLIDAGTDKGIGFGNPVMTEHGLIGRITGTSREVSRILLVTDVTSHIPVMVMRTEARAMMKGDGGGYPRLDFVRGRDSLKKGDQIVTSGDGGIFPRGLPIGEVRQGPDKVWRVKLYADRAPIDFVKVLLFRDFSQLPDAETLLRTPSVTQILPPPPLATTAAQAGIVGAPPPTRLAPSARSNGPAPQAPARQSAASSTSASSSSSQAAPAPVATVGGPQ